MLSLERRLGEGSSAPAASQERRLGEGSYGEVYEVLSPRGHAPHACKRLRPHKKQASEGLSLTAYRELGIASQLSRLAHPNIMPLRRVEHRVEGASSMWHLNLIFDLAKSDLHQHLQATRKAGQSFTLAEVREMTRQIVSGVAFLHSHRIMHRDLSPSNILLFEGGALKITDFGLARSFWAPIKPLAADGAVVKVWYRAPELLLGHKGYGAAIDVWSVGCIFAELFLLRPPFRAKEEPPRKPQMPQLDAVFESLGEPDEQSWHERTSLPLWRDALSAGIVGRRRDGESLVRQLAELCARSRPCAAAVALLEEMLRYSPEKRITARQALASVFFSDGA